MLLRSLLAVLLLLSGLAAAVAQTADVPVMGTSGIVDDAPTSDTSEERRHILVAGDAIGGGLGAGLSRMAQAGDIYDVTIRYNEESGLARPEVYDWAETLPKILEGKDYDAVVIMLGSNDRQQIRSESMRLAFNTPEWTASYAARLDQVLDAAMTTGAKVYWVGLPPMASPDYDASMRIISLVQRERAEAKGAVYLDIRPYLLGADGSYSDTGPDETGTIRKLRGRDGITFFKQGNNRMGQIVLAAIMKGAPAATAPEIAAAPTAAKTARADMPEATVPIFGRAAGGGEDVLDQPQDVSSNAVIALGSESPVAVGEVLSALQAVARPGSNAAKLFTTGEAAKAPAGRVDDFTAPPPQAD